MQATRPDFEPVAWWYTRQAIGRGLREHFELTADLSPQLLLLVKKLDDGSSPSIAAN
jgi:hypothetical protein